VIEQVENRNVTNYQLGCCIFPERNRLGKEQFDVTV